MIIRKAFSPHGESSRVGLREKSQGADNGDEEDNALPILCSPTATRRTFTATSGSRWWWRAGKGCRQRQRPQRRFDSNPNVKKLDAKRRMVWQDIL